MANGFVDADDTVDTHSERNNVNDGSKRNILSFVVVVEVVPVVVDHLL